MSDAPDAAPDVAPVASDVIAVQSAADVQSEDASQRQPSAFEAAVADDSPAAPADDAAADAPRTPEGGPAQTPPEAAREASMVSASPRESAATGGGDAVPAPAGDDAARPPPLAAIPSVTSTAADPASYDQVGTLDDMPASPTIPPPGSPAASRTNWERKCRELEKRAAALERLLLAAQEQAESKASLLQSELQRKNEKIKTLERSVESERKEKGELGGELDKTKADLNRHMSISSQMKRRASKLEKKSSLTPSQAPSTSGGGGGNEAVLSDIIAAKLKDTLEVVKEKDRIIQSLMKGQAAGGGAPTPFASEGPIMHGAPAGGSVEQQQIIVQARDCINDLKRVVAARDAEIATLKTKLANAQSAIMTNVDGIAELDSKLQQSRKALRWLLRANHMAPSSSRSPSPLVYNAAGSPGRGNVPPAYGASTGYGSPPAQYGARGYSASPPAATAGQPQANLGYEQLQALRELENMLATREAAQRQAYPSPGAARY